MSEDLIKRAREMADGQIHASVFGVGDATRRMLRDLAEALEEAGKQQTWWIGEMSLPPQAEIPRLRDLVGDLQAERQSLAEEARALQGCAGTEWLVRVCALVERVAGEAPKP